MSTSLPVQRSDSRHIAEGATFSIILALSFSHFLNDTMQSLVPALYPMLKDSYGLSFAQIGLITLTMQVTSSLLQPAVGLFHDEVFDETRVFPVIFLTQHRLNRFLG